MRLEKIKNFEWYNEPQNVGFTEEGLAIETLPNTDFWQNADHNFYKDNGHFFYQAKEGDFVLAARLSFPHIKESAQGGIMARFDAKNWIKAGLLSPNQYNLQLGIVVANQGSSDWSIVDLPNDTERLWLKIRRRGNDFIVWYGLSEEDLKQVRMCHLSKIEKPMKIGAYACSPKEESFECILEDIDIRN